MDKDKPIRPNSTETSAEKLLVKNLDQDLSGFSKKNVKQNNKKITVNRTVAKIVFVFSLVIIVQLLILVGVVVWLTSNDVEQPSVVANQQRKEQTMFNKLVGNQNEDYLFGDYTDDYITLVGDYTDDQHLTPSEAGIINELKHDGTNMAFTSFRLWRNGKINVVKNGLYLLNLNMLFCKKNYKPVYHLKIDKATHFSCFGKPDETCSVSGVVKLRKDQVITIEAPKNTCFNRKDRNLYIDMTRLS